MPHQKNKSLPASGKNHGAALLIFMENQKGRPMILSHILTFYVR